MPVNINRLSSRRHAVAESLVLASYALRHHSHPRRSGKLAAALRELDRVADAKGYELQMILSTTARRTARGRRFARRRPNDPRILGIRFRRNFGKAAALSAGLSRRRRRPHCHARRRPAGRSGRDPPPAGEARRRLRRGERLETRAARSVAQGVAVAGVQLAGEPPDRRPSARSQLRAESVSAAK